MTFGEQILEYEAREAAFDAMSKRAYLVLAIVAVAALIVIAWKT